MSYTEFQRCLDYWAKASTSLNWQKPWETLFEGGFEQGHVKWFADGALNASANCLDRHLPTKAMQLAIIYEGDTPEDTQTLTYQELFDEVCRMCHVLERFELQRGDRVAIYLPLCPLAIVAMLACTRMGLVHTVVFAGFSPHALLERIHDADAKLLITADRYHRGGKCYPLIDNVQPLLPEALNCLVIELTSNSAIEETHTLHSWRQRRPDRAFYYPPVEMGAEEALFILYTSGSTGKPKGLVHTTGGYLTMAHHTFKTVFKPTPDDRYWCTADIGWITGHSYIVYGPLSNATTLFIYSGVPMWPTPARMYELIDKYGITILYTAPTLIRSLMQKGEAWRKPYHLQSLRLLGSVGEPINPEAWRWYFEHVGNQNCPIIDTWWQTETGAIMLCPPSHQLHNKPGQATAALPCIHPVLLNEANEEINGVNQSGRLAIKYPWPSIARTIHNNHKRYLAYFQSGYYITGDGAKRDQDGDWQITGRTDDVLNVSGHRLGSAEIENALILHARVAEAAVIGTPHPITGEAIMAFVSLKDASSEPLHLKASLEKIVVDEIGAIARPQRVIVVGDLPKTRSGKIMRRILKILAQNPAASKQDLGDLSTLANPECLDAIRVVLSEHEAVAPKA